MLVQNITLLVKVWIGSYVLLFGLQSLLYALKTDHLKLFSIYLFAKVNIALWPVLKPLLQSLDEVFHALLGHSVFPVAYKSFTALRTEAFVFDRHINLPSYLFVQNKYVNAQLGEIFQIHYVSLALACSIVLLMLLRFRRIAQKVEDKRTVKGASLITGTKLNALLKKAGLVSAFKIGHTSLQKNTESQHMLLLGATGSGKTTALHQLIPQIRKQKNRAIIIDQKGDMVGQHYDPEKDILLNPFDARSPQWDIWAEGADDVTLDMLAGYLFPADTYKSDPFWERSAGIVFKYTAKYLKDKKTKSMTLLAKLMASSDPPKSLVEFLKNEASDAFTNDSVEKTILNIRMMMTLVADKIRYFKNQENKETFSLKDWVQEDKKDGQFLFITIGPNQKEALLPFVQFWISWFMAVVEGLKETNPSNINSKLWFLVDELPALRKIHQLEHSLAFMRSYGGCFVAGMQNIYQLQEIYGYAQTRSMLTNFSTKICFRLGDDPDTRNYVSNFFGEKQSIETQENFSIGSHQMRDGVNINAQKNTESVVDKYELNNLKQTKKYVEAILKLPGNFPPAKIKVKFSKFRDPLPRYVSISSKAPEEKSTQEKIKKKD
tara:strand:+ start:22614 stop:24425 length:1812 start_codon:yes stop_codon:yes gene_type:complete